MIPDSISQVIYMDIDTIIFEDLANLHTYFDRYPDKIMYLTMESYRENNGWYAKKNWKLSGKTHIYQPTGINSGVILMNLHLMRKLSPPLNAETFIRANDEPITMGKRLIDFYIIVYLPLTLLQGIKIFITHGAIIIRIKYLFYLVSGI